MKMNMKVPYRKELLVHRYRKIIKATFIKKINIYISLEYLFMLNTVLFILLYPDYDTKNMV